MNRHRRGIEPRRRVAVDEVLEAHPMRRHFDVVRLEDAHRLARPVLQRERRRDVDLQYWASGSASAKRLPWCVVTHGPRARSLATACATATFSCVENFQKNERCGACRAAHPVCRPRTFPYASGALACFPPRWFISKCRSLPARHSRSSTPPSVLGACCLVPESHRLRSINRCPRGCSAFSRSLPSTIRAPPSRAVSPAVTPRPLRQFGARGVPRGWSLSRTSAGAPSPPGDCEFASSDSHQSPYARVLRLLTTVAKLVTLCCADAEPRGAGSHPAPPAAGFETGRLGGNARASAWTEPKPEGIDPVDRVGRRVSGRLTRWLKASWSTSTPPPRNPSSCGARGTAQPFCVGAVVDGFGLLAFGRGAVA